MRSPATPLSLLLALGLDQCLPGASEVRGVVVPPESKSRARKASSVARDHLSFFRQLFSSLPCSSNRPQRHRRNCNQYPVSTPKEVCHTEQDPAICHEEQKEKTVRSCKPVEVPSSHKVCNQVPHRACRQEPYQSCRKVPSTVPVKVARQVCL